MSGASYSSDFLNEAPMIITPTRSTVRQVLGVVKAEVINTPPTPNTSDSLRSPTLTSRPPITSPLAATSFGPADVVREVDESRTSANPFSDPYHTMGGSSPTPSVATLGHPSPPHSDSAPDRQAMPPPKERLSRPASMSTITDVGTANLVFNQMLHPSTAGANTLEEQQQRALAHAQAQAQAQILDDGKRVSSASVTSSVSRTDSILESFPFVPPSPISDRPARSPPVSPLVQQSFGGGSSPLAQVFANSHTVVESKAARDNTQVPGSDDLPAPPSRQNLGLSTGSQLSTVSSGLGSFPFQIDPPTPEGPSQPPSAYSSRQRASLDTLALTSDLASHPLRFDRAGGAPKAG
jgi:protein OPY2